METSNVKCTKCGYVFDSDIEKEQSTCPLCSSEIDTKEALQFYDNEHQNSSTQAPKRSTMRILLDWAIFAVGLALFITILTYLFEFILGK